MKKQILSFFVVFSTALVFAQTTVNANHINLVDKVAIQGYDPVAYFESNKAIEGNKEIKTEYNGAIYYFSSESNKALFLKNPSQYEPQFGGFCAYGVSEGHESPIKPEAFTIVDNKLYLNYNLKVKEIWSKDRAARIEKATINWQKIQSE
jgi:YHS domain-containing protein